MTCYNGNHLCCILASDCGDESRRHHKKARTAFSTEQVTELERRYLQQKYLPAYDRAAFAKQVGLSDQQVRRHIFYLISMI